MNMDGRLQKIIETLLPHHVKIKFIMIIAVVNQKGGVGKTTTTLNLGAALAAQNVRVRLFDLDVQQSLMFLSEGNNRISVETADETTLKAALKANEIDFTLLDCPPALGEATAAALQHAQLVIAPTPPRILDLAGLSQLKSTIEAARQRVNPALRLRILLAMRDARVTLQRDYESQLRQAFADEVFQTVIPRTALFERAADAHTTLLDFAPRSAAAESYRQLAAEVRRLSGK